MRAALSTSKTKLPVSCFIIAKDEADRIAKAIESVTGWVDEVIVIDSGSTDETQDVAKAAGARVLFNAWRGFGQQKRFGEDQCRNDWILNIDADEIVTAELRSELEELFAKGSPTLAGYGMNIILIYPGSSKPRPFARDCYAVRLYNRRQARFKDSTLFDSVDTKGQKTGQLSGILDHYSVRSLGDLIRKCDERATYNAENSRPRLRAILAVRLLFEFPMNFLKEYFVRRHFLGGVMGLKYASIISYYRWVRIVRMLKLSTPENSN